MAIKKSKKVGKGLWQMTNAEELRLFYKAVRKQLKKNKLIKTK